ncbi:MAG: hypothetical protein WBA74_15810 [Cyclobacteriaceae bacterium]
MDQTDEISYKEIDSAYHVTIHTYDEQMIILREPYKKEIIRYKERFTVKEKEFSSFRHIMNESDFVKFVKMGNLWKGNCKDCSWDNYKNIIVIIPNEERKVYSAFVLAEGIEIMVDI